MGGAWWNRRVHSGPNSPSEPHLVMLSIVGTASRRWNRIATGKTEPHLGSKTETVVNRTESWKQLKLRYVNVATADVRRARGDAGWVAPIRCESDQ